jgi:CRP-like cAMP-binding protein
MDPGRLREVGLFAALSDDERDRLAQVVAEREVEAGEHVMEEGDFGAALFAIEEGTAEVLRGDERIVSLGPGDVFGEIAVVRSGRRIATVRATSRLRLITILNRDVWKLERESPATASALRALVEQRARQTLGTE